MQSFKRIDLNTADIFNVPVINQLFKSHEHVMQNFFTEQMDRYANVHHLEDEEKVPLENFNTIVRGGFPCMCRTCALWSLSPANRQNKSNMCTCDAHLTNESFCKYCGTYGYAQNTEDRLVINIPLPLFITKYFTSKDSSKYMEALLGYLLWNTGEDMSLYAKYPNEQSPDFNPLNLRDDSIPVVDAPNALHFAEGENAAILLAYGANPNLYTKTWYKSKICTTYIDQKWKNEEDEVACALSENRTPLFSPGNLRYKIHTPLFFSDMHRIMFSKVHEVYVDKDGNKVPSSFENKNLPMTLALLENGADPNAVDSENKTPIFFSNLVKTILLIQFGADVNHLDSHGRDASSFADKYKKQYIEDIRSGKFNKFVNPVISSYRNPVLHQFNASGRRISPEQAAEIHKSVARNDSRRGNWNNDGGRGSGGNNRSSWHNRQQNNNQGDGDWQQTRNSRNNRRGGGKSGWNSSNRW